MSSVPSEVVDAELTAVGPILLEARSPREFPGPSSPNAGKTEEGKIVQRSRSSARTSEGTKLQRETRSELTKEDSIKDGESLQEEDSKDKLSQKRVAELDVFSTVLMLVAKLTAMFSGLVKGVYAPERMNPKRDCMQRPKIMVLREKEETRVRVRRRKQSIEQRAEGRRQFYGFESS